MLRLTKADGMVCSADAARFLNHLRYAHHPDPFLLVVAGIRPDWAGKKDDQKRFVTPTEALKSGADYIIIGRPVITLPEILAVRWKP